MRGMIHGIWLVTAGNKLHPQVIPNLSSLVTAAKANDFAIVLWTNTQELASEELARLQASKILVMDHSGCASSPLYKYFLNFFNLGLKGDKTAFAFASDVLRMAILDLTADQQYFIYLDPNDIVLNDLNTSLQNLDTKMHNNSLGFVFPVEPSIHQANSFDIRNDVLIALKNKNLAFFKDYLQSYWVNLEKTYKSYVKPTTDTSAQQQVNLISNQITPTFFNVNSFNDGKVRVVAQFGKYFEVYQAVNSNQYLNSHREMAYGNTWLPKGELREEWAELVKSGVVSEAEIVKIKQSSKEMLQALTSDNLPVNYKFMGGGIMLSLLVVTVSVLWFKNKFGTWFKSTAHIH